MEQPAAHLNHDHLPDHDDRSNDIDQRTNRHLNITVDDVEHVRAIFNNDERNNAILDHLLATRYDLDERAGVYHCKPNLDIFDLINHRVDVIDEFFEHRTDDVLITDDDG